MKPVINLEAFGVGLILNPKQVGSTEDLVRIELEAEDAVRLRKWLDVVFPLCDFCRRDCSRGYERTSGFEPTRKGEVKHNPQTGELTFTQTGEGVRCEPPCEAALAAANKLLKILDREPDSLDRACALAASTLDAAKKLQEDLEPPCTS